MVVIMISWCCEAGWHWVWYIILIHGSIVHLKTPVPKARSQPSSVSVHADHFRICKGANLNGQHATWTLQSCHCWDNKLLKQVRYYVGHDIRFNVGRDVLYDIYIYIYTYGKQVYPLSGIPDIGDYPISGKADIPDIGVYPISEHTPISEFTRYLVYSDIGYF
jgi:hypothetical protein